MSASDGEVAGLEFLGADAIARLDYVTAADALHAALAGGLDPDAQPPRTGVPMGEGELLTMPGVAAGVAVVKAVTVGPRAPRIQGAALVFDAQSLAPVAVLDGPALTALRTAAVSALAVRLLAAPDARRLVIFGRGPQALAHRDAIRAVRPIDEVHLLSRADVSGRGALVAAADVVCCCTTAAEPLFDGRLVRDGACVVAIGSHTPTAAETDTALAARASVVVESAAVALLEAGDVIQAIDTGALDAADLIPLAALCRGTAVVPSGPTLFKGVGMGWQDAVIAAAILAAQPSSATEGAV